MVQILAQIKDKYFSRYPPRRNLNIIPHFLILVSTQLAHRSTIVHQAVFNEPSTFFSFHVRTIDQLPSLPSDITFEICSSSSPSSPVPASSASSSATRGGTEEAFTEGTSGGFIKTERMVSGVHFLTDREEDRTDHLLLPKSEAGESEPEVRKQVGCSRYDFNASMNYERSLVPTNSNDSKSVFEALFT